MSPLVIASFPILFHFYKFQKNVMPEHLYFIHNYACSFPLKSNLNFIILTSYSQVPVSPTPTHIIDQTMPFPLVLRTLEN
jgi:hypothetical protein